MITRQKLLLCVAVSALSFPSFSWAQQQPDAGQTLQDLKEAPSLPKESTVPELGLPQAAKGVKAGGPQVAVQELSFQGNAAFTENEIRAALGDISGQKFDIAALNDLADQVTAFYHENDYPFARAFLPTQSMKGGALTIQIVEGVYGDVALESPKHQEQAAKFLSSLESGKLIKGKELERVSLILDDQPGYNVVPVIRPGKDVGTGDLSFKLTKGKQYGGSVRVDNHGNRYTGRGRAQASGYYNNALMFGDQFTLSGIYTEERMWYGSLGYSAPIGYSGLRGTVGYRHTAYELGKEFNSLDAHGTADIVSAGVNYPIIRSQKQNLTISGVFQHKWLTDEQGSTSSNDKKSSDSLPVTLSFDRRDSLWGGGVTYGSASWKHGYLDLDSGLLATDQTTAKTDGSFDKVNIDVARVQSLPFEALKKVNVYGRFTGQKAFDNLDSSEDFGLGGPSGVRAYPTGEAYGDEGALGQLELRYAHDEMLTPYAFYDYGHVKTNHDPWATGDNERTLGGAGLGLRVNYEDWSADTSVAWRTIGGKVQSDSHDYLPIFWVSVSRAF